MKKNYSIITGTYWAFMLTDGALRMLVLLYFHKIGYTPIELSLLFLLYEFFGVVTNLLAGWISTHLGLKPTLTIGLFIQIIALFVLSLTETIPKEYLLYLIMGGQALSGIAKDFTKMSSKSAIKTLAKKDIKDKEKHLFLRTAIITGSKNAVKGGGFFLGGLLLTTIGYKCSLYYLASLILISFFISMFFLPKNLGEIKSKATIKSIFSWDKSINKLSLARIFLFGARDIWFVVAIPIFMSEKLKWNFNEIGAFLSLWIIGYGIVQSTAPLILKTINKKTPTMNTTRQLSLYLSIVLLPLIFTNEKNITIITLVIFGILFALNSSVHSYLILSYSKTKDIGASVGFYYSSNALGRLIGTLLSGITYQYGGLKTTILAAIIFTLTSGLASKIQNKNIVNLQN